MMNDPQLITLRLVPSLIVETVKTDTFIRGKIEKAGAENAEALAYNKQAGDDEFHERKIQSAIVQAAEEVRSRIAAIVSPGIRFGYEEESTTLNIDFDNDVIELAFYASSRLNPTLANTMARTAQRYIADKVLADWFIVFDAQQSAAYQQAATQDMAVLMRSFNRMPPTLPPCPYPRFIHFDEKEVTVTVGQTVRLSYDVLPPPARNDVAIFQRTPTLSDVKNDLANRSITITGTYPGHELITLYSVHDDSVSTTLKINIDEPPSP